MHYSYAAPVPPKSARKQKEPGAALRQCIGTPVKTQRTGIGLNKKIYGQKTAFFTFFSATELSSTVASYPCLSRTDIRAPIALIARTAAVHCHQSPARIL